MNTPGGMVQADRAGGACVPLKWCTAAAAVKCGRNTVSRTLQRAEKYSLTWHDAKDMSIGAIQKHLFPAANDHPQYRMPDYEKVHREMQKSGVTLTPFFRSSLRM